MEGPTEATPDYQSPADWSVVLWVSVRSQREGEIGVEKERGKERERVGKKY